MSQRSELVGGRLDLARLCNAKGLTHEAVEVGTDRGAFAAAFLQIWKGEQLFCVDPYVRYHEMPWNREPDVALALLRLSAFGDRVRLVRETSLSAASIFTGLRRTFQFVYLDGDHTYPAVREDLAAWYPLVRKGGILAGHDYDPVNHPGVIKAVDEFFEGKEEHVVRLTSDYNAPISWYVEVP